MEWFAPVDERGKRRRLTRADLLGHTAMSYQRISSHGQDGEDKSGLERQALVLDQVLAQFGLVLDQSIIDRAMSASKGHHISRGKLGDLLVMADDGDIERGMVLIVETYERLFCEGWTKVAGLLERLVKAGIILVTGSDMAIWCEVSIEEDNHKLVTEINCAKKYTKRMTDTARGAHAKRRRQLLACVDDPTAPVPKLSGKPPGWFVKRPDGTLEFS